MENEHVSIEDHTEAGSFTPTEPSQVDRGDTVGLPPKRRTGRHRKPKPLSDNVRLALKRMVEEGRPRAEITQELQIPVSAYLTVKREVQLSAIITPEWVLAAQRLFEDGKTLKEVGAALSIDPGKLKKMLVIAGAQFPSVDFEKLVQNQRVARSGPTKAQAIRKSKFIDLQIEYAVEEMLQQGLTLRQISSSQGLPLKTVREIARGAQLRPFEISTPGNRAALERMVEAGKSNSQIAIKLRLSVRTVHRIRAHLLRLEGYTHEFMHQVSEMVWAGHRRCEIARILDARICRVDHVRAALDLCGFRREEDPAVRRDVKLFLRRGKNKEEISQALRIPVAGVSRIMQQIGPVAVAKKYAPKPSLLTRKGTPGRVKASRQSGETSASL